MSNPHQVLQAAFTHYSKRNIPQAEALARYLVSISEELSNSYSLLGLVSLSIGLPGYALGYFQKALDIDSSHVIAKNNLKLARKEIKRQKRKGKTKGRFLLVKAWGCGFWADMDHVLGQLLLGRNDREDTRSALGKNSLYHDGACDNAFGLYFDPVSDGMIENLSAGAYSYFPPKWNPYNLQIPENNKWQGDYSRMAGLYFVARDEDVIVSDFHTYVSDLIPWIDVRSPLSGMSAQDLYRYLFKKYIRLKPDLVSEIDQYWSQHIKDRSVLAVHVRGSDKISESLKLKEINASYVDHVSGYLSDRPDRAIFLLTDSAAVLDEYRQKYKEKLLYSDCFRTGSSVGIHHQKHDDRRRIGIEIIKDTYLASRCDAFIGHGGSNVSTTILHLKEWQQTDYTLLGVNQLYQTHLFLHNR